MIVMGNPPYSISSNNRGKWIKKLLKDYKKNLNEKKLNLDDDYIKFIRLAQYYVERNGKGIVAYITNNSFIDGITHRQMRNELMRVFDKIYILDLHGNSRKKEVCPDGSKDKNVFDIQQGVSINIFVKTGRKDKEELATIYHQDLFGEREFKYTTLNEASLSTISWDNLTPNKPYYFFVPKDFSVQDEYDKGIKVDELMKVNVSGFQTKRDSLTIHNTKESLGQVLRDFKNLEPETLKQKYAVSDTRDWTVVSAKEDVCSDHGNIIPVLYRLFDVRYSYFSDKTKGFMAYPRYDLMKNFLKKNVGLCLVRINRDFASTYFVTQLVTDQTLLSPKDNDYVFPLYIYQENMGKEERIVNFDKDLYDKIAEKLNYLPCYENNIQIDPTSDYNGVLYPQDLFDYIYAVLHSPCYRERYKEFLKIDFPRIPYPTDWEKYRNLVEKGKKLRHLHLMEGLPNQTGVSFPKAGTLQVDCYRWQENRVYINSKQYFEGVPESAWNFYIGGYQPAQKWLKDRQDMTLTFEDVKHYQHIIYVLQQTERIMNEIDKS